MIQGSKDCPPWSVYRLYDQGIESPILYRAFGTNPWPVKKTQRRDHNEAWLGKMRKLKRCHANGLLCWFQKTWAYKSPRAHAGFDPVSMFLRCGPCKSWRLTSHEEGLKKPYVHSWYLYIRFPLTPCLWNLFLSWTQWTHEDRVCRACAV